MEYEADDACWDVFDTFKSFGKDDAMAKTPGIGVMDLQLACMHCDKSNVTLDDGNYVCLNCGTLFDRFIDTNAEWRYYGHEDSKGSDPTRCGLPTNELLPDSSLGTMIGNGQGECYEMRIIRKYQMWNSMTYKERTLYNIFDLLTVNAVNNGIPQVIIDEAKALYKKVSEQRLSRGDNRAGLIASSIYMACKTNNVPRSAKEIAAFFNIKTTVMTKGCKNFKDILKMEVPSTTACDFIQRFSSKINLDKHIKDICVGVVLKADEMSLVSNSTPPSIASGSIFLVCTVCGIPIDKKAFAAAVQVSGVTIAKCYKTLHKYRAYIFDQETIAQYNIV